MAIPATYIQELVARNDIYDTISRYVSLQRAGRLYKGLCPFHSERSPSFMVYPETQSYYCFGCGAGGDVIKFTMEMNSLSYIEAIRFLAQQCGMPMPDEDDGQAKLKSRILQMNKLAARFFYDTLNSEAGRNARKYLRDRQLSDKTIVNFGLGYAPAEWQGLTNYLRSKGFTDEEMVRGYLAARNKNGNLYDIFRDRVMFPIIDLRGNGGGIIDEAIQIVGFFVPKNTEVVSTKGKTERSNHVYTTQTSPIFPHMPLVVLVNDQSASASEILAGALQDLHRATIVGERTFGKGLVQNIRPIAYGGHLKVTTSKYYLPSGRCIQAIDYAERQRGHQLHRDTAGGILPDVLLTDSQKLDITYNLYRDHLFFDYATRYYREHATIPQPSDFRLTDQDIENFCLFLDEQHFSYETETGRYLGELIQMAKQEDLDSTLLADLQALQPRFTVDYRAAIQRNRQEVEKLLGGEIVKRYYYHRGYYAYMLRYDEQIRRAIQEITRH